MAKLKCTKHANRIMFFEKHDDAEDIRVIHRHDGRECSSNVFKIDGAIYSREELARRQTPRRNR